jgi:hypothetical protein
VLIAVGARRVGGYEGYVTGDEEKPLTAEIAETPQRTQRNQNILDCGEPMRSLHFSMFAFASFALSGFPLRDFCANSASFAVKSFG